MLLIHGLGEHQGRYFSFLPFFKDRGVQVMSVDLPGHGRSTGKRGHIGRYAEFLDVLTQAEHKLREFGGTRPVVYWGQSMGGNLVLNQAWRGKTQAVAFVATSPWIRLAFKPGTVKQGLAVVANKLFPSLRQNNSLELNCLSHDPQVAADYAADPLVHQSITPRLFMEVQKAGLLVKANAHQISRPVYIFHGTGDAITSHVASEELAAKNSLIQYHGYPGAYHELHHENVRDEHLNRMLSFFMTQTDGRSS